MEKASKVMYKIANIFNWIELVCGILLVVFGILMLTGAVVANSASSVDLVGGAAGLMVVGIWMLIVSIVMVVMTRVAYAKGSSKGWDIFFLVFGIVAENVFYILGGIFGIVARN